MRSVWLVFCDHDFHFVCPLMDKYKKVVEASSWERLTIEESGSCSDEWGHASKSLIRFSIDGWGCVPSLLFGLRPNYGRGNNSNDDLLQKVPCREGTQPHPSTDNWIKDLLSMALPIKKKKNTQFPPQSVSSGSFHKPLIFLHQSADRLKQGKGY